jgi:hypothetical protein
MLQFWSFQEISFLSNGNDFGWRSELFDMILKGDHVMFFCLLKWYVVWPKRKTLTLFLNLVTEKWLIQKEQECAYQPVTHHINLSWVMVFNAIHLPVQSVPITTKVVSSNPAQERCTRYNILRYSLSVTCDRSVVGRPVKSKSHPYTEVCTNKYTNVVTIQLIFHNPLSYVSGHIGPWSRAILTAL